MKELSLRGADRAPYSGAVPGPPVSTGGSVACWRSLDGYHGRQCATRPWATRSRHSARCGGRGHWGRAQ